MELWTPNKKSKARNDSIVVDDFWIDSDTIFVDNFLVNKGYVH
jgi:hypothetical protein